MAALEMKPLYMYISCQAVILEESRNSDGCVVISTSQCCARSINCAYVFGNFGLQTDNVFVN